MARIVFLVLLALLLLAPTARAGEREAENRFHEAYVQEVIEGKTAPAARVYLELVRDPEASPAIRAEARFRFAICAVLLGRPDEARVNLVALLNDEATPAALKARAEEYLATIGDLGVGSELEKKLQALVFDLGRVDPEGAEVAPYRDFEIIGDNALPFLRQLLEHRDRNLRRHAFRLLARMGEEGLFERWDAEIGLAGHPFRNDVVDYLEQRPEQVRIFERNLLALDDEALSGVLAWMPPGPEFSMEFLRSLVQRPAQRRATVELLSSVPDHRWALLREWVQGDDAELRKLAAAGIPSWVKWAPEGVAEELWPHWIRERGQWWRQGHTYRDQIEKYIGLLPTKTLLASVQTLLEESAAWVASERPEGREPIHSMLVNVVAREVAQRISEGRAAPAELTRYTELLKREISLGVAIAEKTETAMDRRDYRWPVAPILDRSRQLLGALPPKEGAELVTWLVEGPARGRVQAWTSLFAGKQASDVALVAAAAKVAEKGERAVLLSRLPGSPKAKPLPPDVAEAVLRALPGLLPALGDGDKWPPLWTYDYTARSAAPEAQRTHLDALFDAAEAKGEGVLDRVVVQMLPTQRTSISGRVSRSGGDEQQAVFLSTSALDALEPRLERLAEPTRDHVVKLAAELYRQHGKDALDDTQRKRLAAFLRAHLDPATGDGWKTLYLSDEDFPLETWLRRAPANVASAVYRDAARADELARAWAKTPEKLNQTLLLFIALHASDAVATEIIDAVLRGSHEAPRRFALYVTRDREGHPASVDALEHALGELLAVEDPGVNVAFQVSWLAKMLAARRPSERLYPAVRFLLQRPEAELFETGCDVAARLGREELVPDLSRLLYSMDPSIRFLAEKAIAAIQSVAKMRAEAEARAAGVK